MKLASMNVNGLKKLDISDYYFVDQENCIYFNSFNTGKLELLKDAEIDDFIVLSNFYSHDCKRVYHESKLLKKNYKSLIDYKNYGYFKIDNVLYWFGKKVQTDFTGELKNIAKHFFTDDVNLIVNGKRFSFDIGSFKVLNEFYAKDNKQVFHSDKLIGEADSESFRVLGEHSALSDGLLSTYPFLNKDSYSPWACDQHQVYFCGQPFLPGVIDPASTKGFHSHVLKDEKHVYYFDKVVEGADSDTFEPLIRQYAKATMTTDLFTYYYRDYRTLYFLYQDGRSERNNTILPISKVNLKKNKEVLLKLLENSIRYQLKPTEVELVEQLLKK